MNKKRIIAVMYGIIAAIIWIGILVVMLTGCKAEASSAPTETMVEEAPSGRITVSALDRPSLIYPCIYIITDNETGKQYLYIYGPGEYGGLCHLEE